MKQFVYFKSTMRSIGRSRCALAVCLATLGLGVSATAAEAPQAQYVVIELGGIRAFDISESGQIVGSKTAPAPESIHAAFWPSSHSAAIDLGILPGLSSVALGMNPQREIVGMAFSANLAVRRALFWASPYSAPAELPGLPPGLIGYAKAINPSGQIVGNFFSAGDSVQWAVFWPKSNASPVYLPQLLPHSAASGINASGNILGDGCDADFVECHAAFWESSTSNPVALASPGGEFIYTDINGYGANPFGAVLNGAGSMVGYAYNADRSETRAVFWASSSSPAVILSTEGEFTNALAVGISDNGQIVGAAYDEHFSRHRPFLWLSASSLGIDLTRFFPADWNLDSIFADAVNNRGEIVGRGLFKDGTSHNFVLIPVRGP